MSAGFSIGLVRKNHGHLVRVLVIFFLLHAGADLVMPQYFCSGEEVGSIPVQRDALAVISETDIPTLISVSSPTNSQPEQPQEQEPHEEDCFCCCAHVLPGAVIGSLVAFDLTSLPSPPGMASLPSPPLRGTYHPPRFA